MRRLPLVLTVLVPLGVLVWAGADNRAHHWSWKDADLDRNRLSLAWSRGAESGDLLAGWIEHGEVVSYSGFSGRTDGGDAEVLVRYDRQETDWFGVATEEIERDCYRFTFADAYEVDFDRVGCPPGKSFGTRIRHAAR